MSYTTIDDPTIYFNTVTYTGNGQASHAITGVGHQPDWVWIKRRDGTVNHLLHDSIRGVTKLLVSNTTGADDVNTNILLGFDSDGFRVGANSASNVSSGTFVSWNWKAGGSTSSNSDGDITSTVSVNTTAGFSIVSYTGSGTTSNTVGHGLSSIDWLIVKSRDETDSWFVKHKSLSSSKNLNLDQTVAETDVTSAYSEGGLSNLSGNTFGFLDGTSDANAVNESSEAHIAYCFKGVQGYSKFGKYSANNNADGPFIYTGFKPAWLMLKVIAGNTGGWDMYDNKRGSYNGQVSMLQANSSNAQATSDVVDFLSNGFKIRNTSGNQNGSGDTIVYMAFAESPFVNSKGVPTNAR